MKKVFLLMGYSGSGKTEVAKALQGRGYNILQSYTTRQPRHENEWGHIFTSNEVYEQLERDKQVAAYSYFDGNHYFSTKDQIYSTDIYVVDPDGIKELKETVKDVEFVVIYLKVDKETRMERMKNRGDSVDKILKRISGDGRKFRKKRFDYQVINYEFVKAVNIIDLIIQTEQDY
ncbi:AAA family ATPase [Paenibacillus sp. CMAA1739]|uniref:AAA family ATPase n=1 Tax=Paenibacillus ottowii TaxID=2315729 RepID=UPI002DBEAF38|nr:AAA family ATPase [Paenibacillus sp. CMAA1739]MEC4565430.1 AAA family ATPase [Paenibacillus sp. CMAA1739]